MHVGVQDLCLGLGENLTVVGLITTKSVLAHVSESGHGLITPVEQLKVSNLLEMRVAGPWTHGELESTLDNVVESGLLEVSLPADGLLARDVSLLCNLEVELAHLDVSRVLWKGTVVGTKVGDETRDFKVGTGLEGTVDLLDEVGPVVDCHGELTGVDEVKDGLAPAPLDLYVVDLGQVSMKRVNKGLGAWRTAYLKANVRWNNLGLEWEEIYSDDPSRRVELGHINSPDTSASTKIEDSLGVLGQGRQVQLVVQKHRVLAVTEVMLDQLPKALADVNNKQQGRTYLDVVAECPSLVLSPGVVMIGVFLELQANFLSNFGQVTRHDAVGVHASGLVVNPVDRLDVGDLSSQRNHRHELADLNVRRTIKDNVSRCRRTRLSVLVVAVWVIFLALATEDARDAPKEGTGLLLRLHDFTSDFPLESG